MKHDLLKRLTVGRNYRSLILVDNIINHEGKDWIVHNAGAESQEESRRLMAEVLDAGCLVTLKTKDGREFENVHPNEVRVKLVYNTGVSAPDNGVVMWTPGNHYGVVQVIHRGATLVAAGFESHGMQITKPIHSKYHRKIKTVEVYDANGQPTTLDIHVDVYDVIRAFNVVSGPMQHALKKVLAAGQRGHKDTLQDLKDIIASVEREIEMQKEGN